MVMTRIKLLCQLASDGNLSDIKKQNFSNSEINTLISWAVLGDPPSILGEYNALMIAASYRQLDVVKYFLEEKQADPNIKGGRNKDFTTLDCAKQRWWFGPAINSDVVNYLENWLYGFLVELHLQEKEKRNVDPAAYDLDSEFFIDGGTYMPIDQQLLVNFCMAFAIKTLQSLPNRSPANQLYLSSSNRYPMALKYVWASFMILGMTLPDEKFGEESINHKCDFSVPSGWFSMFSFNSPNEADIKKHLITDVTKYLNKEHIKDFLTNTSNQIAQKRLAKIRQDKITADHRNQPDLVAQFQQTAAQQAAQSRQPFAPVRSLIPYSLKSNDKDEMFQLAKFHHLGHGGRKDLNLAFDFYIRSAWLGHPEALVLLDNLGKNMSTKKQVELSQLYRFFIKNDEKADFWRAKEMENEPQDQGVSCRQQ